MTAIRNAGARSSASSQVTVLAVNAPKDYRAILGALPDGVSILATSEAAKPSSCIYSRVAQGVDNLLPMPERR